jgi:hypothetical protein
MRTALTLVAILSGGCENGDPATVFDCICNAPAFVPVQPLCRDFTCDSITYRGRLCVLDRDEYGVSAFDVWASLVAQGLKDECVVYTPDLGFYCDCEATGDDCNGETQGIRGDWGIVCN